MFQKKYEEEKHKREKLQRLIGQMADKIDPSLSEKNREFLKNIQDLSRIISTEKEGDLQLNGLDK